MYKKIYKYYPCSDYAFDSVKNNYFVFSCPFDFNDLIDCQITIDSKTASLSPNKFIEKVINETFFDDPEYRDELKSKMVYEEAACEDLYNKKVIQQMIAQFRVSCFSMSSDNTLMWAHYASNHQGFCLEFSYPDNQPNLFMYLSKINYTSQYPVLTMPVFDITDPDNEKQFEAMATTLLLTKQDVWSYEEEYRIILNGDFGEKIPGCRKNKIKYPAEALTGVYFGSHCADNTISTIYGYCVDNKNSSFYKLTPKKDRFGYNTIPLFC